MFCDVFSFSKRARRCPMVKKLLPGLAIFGLGMLSALVGLAVVGPPRAVVRSAVTPAAAPGVTLVLAVGR
jgi:hypothetical protein